MANHGVDIWDSHRLDLARDGDKVKFMIVQNRTNQILAWIDLTPGRVNSHVSRLRTLLDEIEDSSREIAPDRRIR